MAAGCATPPPMQPGNSSSIYQQANMPDATLPSCAAEQQLNQRAQQVLRIGAITIHSTTEIENVFQ